MDRIKYPRTAFEAQWSPLSSRRSRQNKRAGARFQALTAADDVQKHYCFSTGSTGTTACRVRLGEDAASRLLSAVSTACLAAFMAVSYAGLTVWLAVVMNVFHAATAVSLPAGALFDSRSLQPPAL